MSNRGSYYGWVYSGAMSEEEVIGDLKCALASCGLQQLAGTEGLEWTDEGGFIRRLVFDRPPLGLRRTSRVIYTHSKEVQFRPRDLEMNPEDQAATLGEYDRVKQIFDHSKSTECFGCHAVQDNARVLGNSELDFFFSKKGPQLILTHLEEERSPFEHECEFVSPNEMAYLPMLDWDEELHSEFFTRFNEEHPVSFSIVYNAGNELVRLPWNEFYHGSGAR